MVHSLRNILSKVPLKTAVTIPSEAHLTLILITSSNSGDIFFGISYQESLYIFFFLFFWDSFLLFSLIILQAISLGIPSVMSLVVNSVLIQGILSQISFEYQHTFNTISDFFYRFLTVNCFGSFYKKNSSICLRITLKNSVKIPPANSLEMYLTMTFKSHLVKFLQ